MRAIELSHFVGPVILVVSEIGMAFRNIFGICDQPVDLSVYLPSFFIFRFKSFCILMQFEFCDISIQLSSFRNLKFQTNDILVKNPSCSDEAQHRSDRVRKVFIT